MTPDRPAVLPATPGRMPMVPVAAAVLVGGVIDAWATPSTATALTVAAAATLVGGIWEIAIRRGIAGDPGKDVRHGLAPGPSALLLVAVAAIFAAWHGRADRTIADSHLVRMATFAGRPVACEVVVTKGDTPRATPPRPFETRYDDRPRTILQVDAVAVRDGTDWRPATGVGRMIVAGDWAGAAAGDRLRVFGQLSRPEPPANPGVFDFADWARRRGEWYLISVDQPEAVTTIAPGPWWNIARRIEALRAGLEANLRRHLPPRQADLAVALTLGDRTGLDAEQTELYLVTGAIHVLAISGLHVAILAAGVGGLARLVTRGRRPAILFTLAMIAVYVPLTGARAPVLRAATLVAVWCLGRWVGRPNHLIQTLAVSLIVVLITRPTDLFDTGAQLSFLAVLSLALAARLMRRTEAAREEADHADVLAPRSPEPERNGEGTGTDGPAGRQADDPRSPSDELPATPWWRRGLAGTVAYLASIYQAGLLVWLVCLPMVALRFHVLPLAIVAVNPILGLFVAVALYACLVTMVLGSVAPPVAIVSGAIATAALLGMEGLLTATRAVPLSYLWLPAPAAWWVMATYAALAAWAGRGGRVLRRRAFATAVVGWLVVGLITSPAGRSALTRDDEVATVTFLAVGHGTCAVADLPDGRVLVYDAGSLTSAAGTADALATHLWRSGRTHIDMLVISHADADHYNAVPAILERFTVGLIATPGGLLDRDDDAMLTGLAAAIARRGVPVLELRRGDRLGDAGVDDPSTPSDEGGCRIDVLHPPARFAGGSDNAHSVTLRLSWRGRSVLLPGDLEKEGLATFLATDVVTSDVVMAPHHGSAASSPPELVTAVRPGIVVLSGPRSVDVDRIAAQYGLPPSQVFHTATDGAVTVALGAGGVAVSGYRSGHTATVGVRP